MDENDDMYEIGREKDGLRETKDGLFIVEEMSQGEKVVFVDLRNGGFNIYGYTGDRDTGQDEVNLDKYRPFPECVQQIRSEVRAIGNSSIGEFV